MIINLNLPQTAIYSKLSVADGTQPYPIPQNSTSHHQQNKSKYNEIFHHFRKSGLRAINKSASLKGVYVIKEL